MMIAGLIMVACAIAATAIHFLAGREPDDSERWWNDVPVQFRDDD